MWCICVVTSFMLPYGDPNELCVTHLRLTKFGFYIFWAKINHLEAHLMLSGWPFQFEKGKMVDLMLEIKWMVSLRYKLLCNHSIYTLKSNQWKTTWWAKFQLEHLLIFICFNTKFKVTCKKHDFKCVNVRIHSKEKTSKISIITFAILHFLHQNALTRLPLSWVLLFSMKPSDMLKDGSF